MTKMSSNPVIKNYAYALVHVPDLVRYGSKPQQEVARDATVLETISSSL